MFNFQLSEVEQRNVDDFICRQEATQTTPGSAIGGRWTYLFTPTTIGLVVLIKDCLLNATADVTDYEMF
jgi:hypothetical protein